MPGLAALGEEDERPPYQQMTDILRNAIASGQLSRGREATVRAEARGATWVRADDDSRANPDRLDEVAELLDRRRVTVLHKSTHDDAA